MRLQDPDTTKVLIVTLPEVTPVSQAAALQDDLRRAKIEPWAWVINKSIAATGTADPLLQARLAGEVRQTGRIANGLAKRTFVLPWLPRPPVVCGAVYVIVTSVWHAPLLYEWALQDKLVSVDNIQRTVAEYYKIKISDLLSKRRSRSVARPRQVAMALSKELTNHSLPEIGDAFGGRDHTTVLHACRTITELRLGDHQLNHDVHVLTQVLRG